MAAKATETDLDAIDMDPDEPAAVMIQHQGAKSPKNPNKPTANNNNGDASKASSASPFDEEDFCGYFARPHVISRFYYGDNNKSQLTEFDGAEKCGGSVFVEGLSGVGITSTVVSAYLVGQLKLPLVAVFYSPDMPGMCSIHSYKATSPVRIYGNESVCVAVGDYELEPVRHSKLVFEITQAFLDFARRHKCRHVVSIDGYPVKGEMEKKIASIAKMVPSEQPKIELQTSQSSDTGDDDEDDGDDDNTDSKNDDSNGNGNNNGKKKKKKKSVFATVGYLTNSPEIGEALKKEGHKPVKTGQIIGVTGAMLTLSFTSASDDPPLTVILAPDPVQIPDQRGALLAVKLLREQFNIGDIDTTALKSEADRLANKIKSTVEQIRAQVARQYAPRVRKPPPSGMYS